ncbi:MAG: cytochrome P450 [Dehalococcoidia bacterium]|nr:cytochrome P450 [Dehalococcoidia bacterium]MYD29939.1 cytochrome P450 [Dehalococcoidia bacterium]
MNASPTAPPLRVERIRVTRRNLSLSVTGTRIPTDRRHCTGVSLPLNGVERAVHCRPSGSWGSAMPVRPFAPHATVDPYPGHRRLLRRSSPYHEPDLDAWVVTRHSDILDILRNPRVFLSSGKTGVDDPSRIIILVNDDPPRHTERRALVQRPMTRRLNDDLDTWIERRVDQLLDAVDPGNVEAMGDFAVGLPVSVITHLLGIPDEDSHRFMRMRSPQRGQTQQEREAEFTAIVGYLRRLVAERRRDPRDDLISEVLAHDRHGPSLQEWEIIGLCITLLVAGNETTSNLIANSLNVLAADPDLWRRLRDQRELVPVFIEEMVRWQSPTQTIFRTTTEATEIGGTRLPAGSVVALGVGAANRDPRVFDHADVMDLERDVRDHLGFGSGAHYCIGAPFSRLETEKLLGAMLDRYDRIEPGERKAQRQNASPFLYGFRHLPLVFRG